MKSFFGKIESTTRILRRLLKGTDAQSTVEYSLIVFFCVLAALLFTYVFVNAITTHHANVSSVVCLPIP